MSIKCQTLVIKFIYSISCSLFKRAAKQRTSVSNGCTDRDSERLTFGRLYQESNQRFPDLIFQRFETCHVRQEKEAIKV